MREKEIWECYLAKKAILYFFVLGFRHFPIKMSVFNLYQLECYNGQWILVIARRVFSEKVLNLQIVFKKLFILFLSTY